MREAPRPRLEAAIEQTMVRRLAVIERPSVNSVPTGPVPRTINPPTWRNSIATTNAMICLCDGVDGPIQVLQYSGID